MIECVPNISEGRDPETIDAVARAVDDTPGVRLLEVDPDWDTNRTVLTFVGEPDAVLQGARRCVEAAVAHIDMRRHEGTHPRMGAADVVPFSPFPDGDLELCSQLARRLATALPADLPGWFYGGDVLLADVRRGQFEGLDDKLRSTAPDFGPRRKHPSAGAVAIGARGVLIAYNVDLDSADVRIARGIARRLREFGDPPGLPGVRALGWKSPSRSGTQVTTNLVDWPTTPPHALLAAVRDEAAARGVEVLGAELVGMIPLAAVFAAGETVAAGLANLALPAACEHKILEIALEKP